MALKISRGTLFIPLKGAPGTLLSWLVTESPSRDVSTKGHSTSNPPKGDLSDLKTKWTLDVSKVDVKGFPSLSAGFHKSGKRALVSAL